MGYYSERKITKLSTTLFILLATFSTGCSPKKTDESPPINFTIREEVPSNERQVLFIAQKGDIDGAIDLYRNWSKENGKNDFALLQSIGEQILREGAYSDDAETVMLATFGAGISESDAGLQILQNLAHSRNPFIQLTAFRALATYSTEEVDRILVKAMGSYILPIRFEALVLLAKKRSPHALEQLEGLMAKLPPEYHSMFPMLLTSLGTDDALIYIRQMLTSPQDYVRLAAIHAAAGANLTEVLPEIRQLATQPNVPQQEACAMALGIFRDQESIPQLREMAKSEYGNLRLPALRGLYLMGDDSAGKAILTMAKEGDLYAIDAMSQVTGRQEVLKELVHSSNEAVRLNALIGLLTEGDPVCLDPNLKENLMTYILRGNRDLGLRTQSTAGRSCHALQLVPSAKEQKGSLGMGNRSHSELAIRYREKLIQLAARTLPRESFLSIAKQILDGKEDDLIPVLMYELQKIGSDEVIALLQENTDRVGAPLIRHYSNLTLLKLDSDGEESKIYRKRLEEWIASSQKHELIRFRAMLAQEDDGIQDSFTITPDERSKLLIESLTTLATMQDEEAMDTLLEAIRFGHPKNRYALAGLLIRTGI